MNGPLRVGVVGCGIGKSHITAYQALPAQFQVVALCDIDQDRVQAVAAENGIERAVTGFDALCAMHDLDVVDICTPSYLHAAQTLQALAAGKHVICEKPVAASLHEVDGLMAAETQSARRVMPIFQYRFGVGMQKLKFLIEQGAAGRAYLTTAETLWRRRPAYYAVPWRGKWATELGGALVTLAIHAHDLVYYALGTARSVYAHMATLVNPIETEDSIAASLQMADGSLCTLAVTTGSARETSRHRFCFSNLTAESQTSPYRNSSEPWSFTADSPESEQRMRETLERFVPLPEHNVGQFSRFYQALQTGAELPVTLADARASLELITALYYSARTRQVVDLPLLPGHPAYGGWRL